MTAMDLHEHRKLTQGELLAEAQERFGNDPKTYAFVCPSCGDVATIGDFIKSGADPDRAGQECIGRSLGALKRGAKRDGNGIVRGKRGCDWAAYGLFRGPWEIVMPAEDGKPERSAWSFPLAPALAVAAAPVVSGAVHHPTEETR